MLDKVLSFISSIKDRNIAKAKAWNPEPPDLIKATREAVRNCTLYSQSSVDKAESAYHKSIKEGRSEDIGSALRKEYEHRRERCSGNVVWVDGYKYPLFRE